MSEPMSRADVARIFDVPEAFLSEGGYVTPTPTADTIPAMLAGCWLFAEAGVVPGDPAQWVDVGYATDDGMVVEYNDDPPPSGLDLTEFIAAWEQVRQAVEISWRAAAISMENLLAAFNGAIFTSVGEDRPKPSGDTLALIDDALGERCACGCGYGITPDSPSAWFHSEECQVNWEYLRRAQHR